MQIVRDIISDIIHTYIYIIITNIICIYMWHSFFISGIRSGRVPELGTGGGGPMHNGHYMVITWSLHGHYCTLRYDYLHSISVHYITVTLHCIAFYCILHYTELQCVAGVALHITLHYVMSGYVMQRWVTLCANTPFRPHTSCLGKINKGIREYKSPTPVKLYIHWTSSIRVKFSHPR